MNSMLPETEALKICLITFANLYSIVYKGTNEILSVYAFYLKYL